MPQAFWISSRDSGSRIPQAQPWGDRGQHVLKEMNEGRMAPTVGAVWLFGVYLQAQRSQAWKAVADVLEDPKIRSPLSRKCLPRILCPLVRVLHT